MARKNPAAEENISQESHVQDKPATNGKTGQDVITEVTSHYSLPPNLRVFPPKSNDDLISEVSEILSITSKDETQREKPTLHPPYIKIEDGDKKHERILTAIHIVMADETDLSQVILTYSTQPDFLLSERTLKYTLP